MVDDPYRVLGISRGASQDEIKKAYRAKSKQCHPDLHPNDPNAAAKMAEVNEAYDMLMNPAKYEKAKAQQQYQQQYQQYQNPYGQGYGQSSSGYSQSGYGQSYGQSNNSGYNDDYYGSYSGSNGWSSNFGWGFGPFGFGFGNFTDGAGSATPPKMPQPMATDSMLVRNAIQAINNRQYQQAVNILNSIVSSQRNARWYYLSAIANGYAGNTVAAMEYIRKAVNLEPNNTEYKNVLMYFQSIAQTYEEESTTSYTSPLKRILPICGSVCLSYSLCSLLTCGRGGYYFCC